MRVRGLDGRDYTLPMRGKEVLGGDTRRRSGPHLLARELLGRIYPLAPILEEVGLPGTDGLVADFILPRERAVIEVHGIQHFRFNAHFHKTRAGFLASVRNDMRKAEWCEINGFRLVVLPDTEGEDEWRERIGGVRPGDDGEGPGGDARPEGAHPDPQARGR
jgi:hypothetical protein